MPFCCGSKTDFIKAKEAVSCANQIRTKITKPLLLNLMKESRGGWGTFTSIVSGGAHAASRDIELGSLFTVNLVLDRSGTTNDIKYSVTGPEGVDLSRSTRHLSGSVTYNNGKGFRELQEGVHNAVEVALDEVVDKKNMSHHDRLYTHVKNHTRAGGVGVMDILAAGAVGAVSAMRHAASHTGRAV